jgi:hypothetical protein
MVAVPMATPVTSPELLTVATEEAEELHVTVLVRLAVCPSEYLPVAASCWVSPTARVGLAGVLAIEESVGVDELPPPQATKKVQIARHRLASRV